MIIGVPKEIKTREYRVGMTPAGARQLTQRGHTVLIQAGAGEGSGVRDEAYVAVGAKIVPSAAEVWAADMVVKVKEPLPAEFAFFREGQILYTYLHLAAEGELTRKLMEKKVRAIAYETIQLPDGSLPLLRPMSEVAGKMSVQVGATSLEKWRGGKGVLLGGVPGTRRGRVVILGGGVVGRNAAKIAIGMGAHVTILDVNPHTMDYLEDIFGAAVETLYSNAQNIEDQCLRADLVVGAVLVPGAKAPTLVSRDLVSRMEKGSVIVDVAIDQGGCVETAHVTSHDQPTYEEQGVIHYGVANMPGAVSHTSTFALTNVTIKYAVDLATHGVVAAIKRDPALALGVNCWDGACVYEAVAQALSLPYTALNVALG
ncbi:MAG: alanine dehydrogenase [Deltaproteobacteria bacterium]|nr:alanine dehydrogenase [Deltaproteobacteria bacterium]